MSLHARLLSLYQFGNGAARYALKKIIAMLAALSNQRLEEQAQRALEYNKKAGQMELDWQNEKETRSQARKGSVATDNKIDKTLSSIKNVLDSHAEMATECRERTLAREMRTELFAAGVAPITSMQFDEEHAAVEDILTRIDNEFTEHANALGLTPLLESLDQLNDTFGEQLDMAETEAITYDEVQAARAKGREEFHKVVFMICGDYANDPETLNKLLAPVMAQNDRIGRYIGRQGNAPDVDPDSGEPTEPTPPNEPSEPTDTTEPTEA